MPVYDIAQGEHLVATVTIQEDGFITWEFDAAWGRLWLTAAARTRLEAVIRQYPHEGFIVYDGVRIRQRDGHGDSSP